MIPMGLEPSALNQMVPCASANSMAGEWVWEAWPCSLRWVASTPNVLGSEVWAYGSVFGPIR